MFPFCASFSGLCPEKQQVCFMSNPSFEIGVSIKIFPFHADNGGNFDKLCFLFINSISQIQEIINSEIQKKYKERKFL